MPNSISKTEQVCILLDDIDARIEVTAKLHKSLARAANGDRRSWPRWSNAAGSKPAMRTCFASST